jgi:hypothetical protein
VGPTMFCNLASPPLASGGPRIFSYLSIYLDR